MKRQLRLLAMVGCVTSVVCAAPSGTAPRSGATRYQAHAQRSGVDIGARLLSSEEARKTFISDLNQCCVVVELAIYPAKDAPLNVVLDSLTLRVNGSDAGTRPSSAKVVSGMLQKRARERRDVSVSPTTGIGYESGTVYDPATGRTRGGGIYTSAGVGVGVGAAGSDPGSSEKDRAVMETELEEKGLAEGEASHPVAGYLYFPVTRTKKATYELEYVLHGDSVKLTFH